VTAREAVPASTDRAGYLDEVCTLLWPPPARADRNGQAGSGQPAVSRLRIVPSSRDPRLLIPAGRRAGAAALRRYGEPGSTRARIATRALSLALAAGAGPLLLRDVIQVSAPTGAATIETHLRDLLGQEVRLSMHLGAARANRKPVLQLLTPGGTTVAFAKVGHTALTRALVRDEQAALERVGAAALTAVTVPEVRQLSAWQGLDVLVMSALPVWRPRRELAPGQLATAMSEVARVAGLTRAPLAGSDYWRQLSGRLAAVPASEDRQALQRELDGLGRAHGDVGLTFGSWHGDWTPWNMACTHDGLLVWDWERFATGVPVGFDALHFWLQAAAVSGQADPAAAAAECIARGPELLGPLGAGAAGARLTARLYLCDLSVRYLADRQAEAGARLGAPGRWLIPALAATGPA
jgi:Phosphotransferase enzyme family